MHSMKRFFTLIIPLLCGLTLAIAVAKEEQAPVAVVVNGKTAYVIVHRADAPTTVLQAAQELRDCVREATGVELEIVSDEEAEGRPYLSVGATAQAMEAGIGSAPIPNDGFRIAVSDENLFIVGPDTADDGWTPAGGSSAGSANGVYALLEDYLDVRWLLPGADGRDVPVRTEWRIPRVDRMEASPFRMREVSHLSDFASPSQAEAIRDWMRKNRLGSTEAVRHAQSKRSDHWQHNWAWITDDRALFEQHPEWFAMDASGARWNPFNHYAKLETTNPELVRFFADHAIATLKSSERPRFYSLTPNDSPTRWSESQESKALYDPPIGTGKETAEFKPQVASKTSLVMKWYHDVANLVAKDYPEGRLSGFIYSDYLYPPKKFTEALPDNLTLIFCAPNYGYELGLKEARDRLSMLLGEWAGKIPGGLYYYDIPSLLLRQEDSDARYNFPGTTALVTPAAPEALNFLFSTLFQHRLQGAYLYGAASWSNAAMANYIVARLLWNPALDARSLQKEWLARAYGADAAANVEKLYHRLDELYGSFGYIGYNLTGRMMEGIYAKHFAELEGYVTEALKQSMTPPQKRRLEALAQNFTALQWRLKNMKLLDQGYRSALSRTDEEMLAMFGDSSGDYPAFPGMLPSPGVFKVEQEFLKASVQPKLPNVEKPALEATTWAVLHAPEAQEVTLLPRMVDHGAYVATYVVKNDRDEVVVSGILSAGKPITFQAEPERTYFLSMPPRSRNSSHPTRCEIVIPDAALAEVAREGDGVVFRKTNARLYVWGDKGGIKSVKEGVAFQK